MTGEAVSFEEVFQWTKFLAFETKNLFHWNVSWKLKKQLNWDLMLRYNVKLTLS